MAAKITMKNTVLLWQIIWIATFFVEGNFVNTQIMDSKAECLEDFSPCTCFPFEVGAINVDCNQIPFTVVKAAFDLTTTTNQIRLFLTLSDNTAEIPANLLGSNKAKEISLECLSRNFEVQIDVDGFRNSQSVGLSFMMNGCSLNQMSLAFLSNFGVLNELMIINSTFPDMSTLPFLPNLYRLTVSNCQGFKTWGNPSLGSVHELYLNSNLLGDTVVSGILTNILASSNSLESLFLRTNSLTRVPDAIHSFTMLSVIDLNDNEIPVVTTGSLVFSAPEVKYIRIEGTSLNTIQTGAFQGYFGRAPVLLTANDLTRFESSVFKPMLQDMANSTGFIQLYFNPIVCDCNLAWLIRDNRDYLKSVLGGTCSNSTQFEDLDPAGFSTCP